jgi:hypothetical protein
VGDGGDDGREADLDRFDTGVAQPARVYDYWLGGTTNFAADREAAEAVLAARPVAGRDIRSNRAFMNRAVAYLAAEGGVRQFLDIGTGIPKSPNVHEIAQGIAPQARVVYVDHDPLVGAYAGALLTSTPAGATAFVAADVREGDTVMRAAGETLDLAQPVAILVIGMLHLISDAEDPYALVARLMAGTAPGSYLAVSHPASDIDAVAAAEVARRYNRSVATPMTRRSRGEVERLMHGLALVEPGVAQTNRWRPTGPGLGAAAADVGNWAAVGRKL